MKSFNEFTQNPLPVQNTPLPEDQMAKSLPQVIGLSKQVFTNMKKGLDKPNEVSSVEVAPNKHIFMVAVQGPTVKLSAIRDQINQQVPRINVIF